MNKKIEKILKEYKWLHYIDSFFNEYGEEFALFEVDESITGYTPKYMVTGDEFNWEIGWAYDHDIKRVYKPFMVSTQERFGLSGIAARNRNKKIRK